MQLGGGGRGEGGGGFDGPGGGAGVAISEEIHVVDVLIKKLPSISSSYQEIHPGGENNISVCISIWGTNRVQDIKVFYSLLFMCFFISNF